MNERSTKTASNEDETQRAKDEDYEELQKDENIAISKAETRLFVLFFLNGFSATKVFFEHLISIDSVVGATLTVALTLYAYFATEDNSQWDGSMDWILLGFAVVTPMSVSIGLAFRRREHALHQLASFRATAWQIYLAHSCWDWGSAGRSSSGRNWLRHADQVLLELIGMGDELRRFLTLPTMSRARHRVTRAGRREANRTVNVAYRVLHSLYTLRIQRLTLLVEDLKAEGLPGNESSRIRDWERRLGEHIENLRMVKMYRSPQALRSFARLFAFFLPPFYAPTYAQFAKDVNSLGMGVAFGIITSLALTCLYNSIYQLEDPFMAKLALDGIDVHEELVVLHFQQLINSRKFFFPHAPELPKQVHGYQLIPDTQRLTSYAQLHE